MDGHRRGKETGKGARSFELRAALALAQALSIDRPPPTEAHAVLAPALEGFSPTPEMPEIAEAQALLTALAETDQVKAAEAQRQRRLHLQTAYGQAMMWAKGFSAEETRAALLAPRRSLQRRPTTLRIASRRPTFSGASPICEANCGLRGSWELSFLKEAEDTGQVVEVGRRPPRPCPGQLPRR